MEQAPLDERNRPAITFCSMGAPNAHTATLAGSTTYDISIQCRRRRCVTMTKRVVTCLPVLAVLFAACGDSVTGNNDGPWIGNWVQVNFLATDDGGVWDEDDLSGIGFVAAVTETEWTLTDEYGGGCSITMSYTVTGNRFSRQAIRAGERCPALPLHLLNESGRLEFSDDRTFMIEHFDLQTGDEIAAFKWVRR
jgi:hypothetical protein